MDINRCKLSVVSLIMITICYFLLSLSIQAFSRGITVKTKTSSGAVKEIQLYSGYHALVVGVSHYDEWPDLPHATKDAQDIAMALKKMGFKVTILTNPTSSKLKKALNDMTYKYGRKTNRALLFYYAGHGETEKLSDGTKLGYIIPKDCPLLKKNPIGFVNKAVSMKDIEAYSLRIRSKHVLMLFDSCFSGSLFSLVRAVPEDITEKSTLPVRQYITAGTEDEVVPDRSMFKRCLLLGLEGDADLTHDGYITGTELGLYLHDKVVQSTHRAQHPQYGKIRTPELSRGDFIFLLASSGAVVEKPAPKVSKAYLSVESNVSGAKVFVDGHYIGTNNLSVIEITPGEYRIRVEKNGYEPYIRKVLFEKGRTKHLHVVMDPKKPLKGYLYVDAQPDNARVRILNIVPKFYQGMELDTGRYHVEVSAKGYEMQKMWVSVSAGQDKTLDINLKRIATFGSASRHKKKITNSLGMKFVFIKPGTFYMGSPSDEPGRYDDEKLHRVTLTKGFYMQTTEVTVGQWRTFVRDTLYESKAETAGGSYTWIKSKWEWKKGIYWDNPGFSQTDNHPATCISWSDALAFVKWLSRKERKTYRLPTEAEWEYSARAGTKTPFAFGRCLSTDQANYHGAYPLSDCLGGEYRNGTLRVAILKPNAWGLYDMHGNVWEWCGNWYASYPSGSVTDPSGVKFDVFPLYFGYMPVYRGGAWGYAARDCRSARRISAYAYDRNPSVGFRLLRNP